MPEEAPQYVGTDGVVLDADTSQILAEAEGRGESIEGATRVNPPAAPAPAAPAEPAKPAEPVKPAEQPKPQEEAPKPAAEPEKREPETVPIWGMKKAVKEAEDRVREEMEGQTQARIDAAVAQAKQEAAAAVQSSTPNADIDAAVKTMQDKYPEMSPEAIRDLLDTSVKLSSKGLSDKLAQVDKLTAAQTAQADAAAFQADLTTIATSLTPEQAAHIQANKAIIQEKAYSEQYIKTPLSTIIKEFLFDTPVPAPKVPKSGMESTPTTPAVALGTDTEGFEDMTEERLSKLPAEMRDKYFDWRDKQDAQFPRRR